MKLKYQNKSWKIYKEMTKNLENNGLKNNRNKLKLFLYI